MKKSIFLLLFLCLVFSLPLKISAEPENTIFDDKMLLDGYANKYASESKDTLIEMVKDDQLTPYMTAAAVRVFREHFGKEVFANEKKIIEKILLRRLSKSASNFVDIEIMHTLCVMDRYKYFESMVPLLIQFLDHYNAAIDDIAYNGLVDIVTNSKRPREARIVFNTLRRGFFLTRKKLINIKEPGPRLKQKLEILRWSIKILGNQELPKLPTEIIDLL